MSRKTAREVAMRVAFARLLGGDSNCEVALEQSEDISDGLTPADIVFAAQIVEGVKDNEEALDAVIGKYAREWSVERLPRVELVILRIAVYELTFSKDVPAGAAISEAVGLAKKYCDDSAYSYINGILGRYTRERTAGSEGES